jgi:hypothetical protein
MIGMGFSSSSLQRREEGGFSGVGETERWVPPKAPEGSVRGESPDKWLDLVRLAGLTSIRRCGRDVEE